MNAKIILFRRDFATDLPALLAQAWRAGEADGRRFPDRRIRELHALEVSKNPCFAGNLAHRYLKN